MSTFEAQSAAISEMSRWSDLTVCLAGHLRSPCPVLHALHLNPFTKPRRRVSATMSGISSPPASRASTSASVVG